MEFQWRLIRRKGQPFLLLPAQSSAARAGVRLYSAQRRIARLGCHILGLKIGASMLRLLPKYNIDADAASAFIVFLRRQTGNACPLIPPAILFSTRAAEKQRFVMLLCDQNNKPITIVKVGLQPSAHAVIERECAFIQSLPRNTSGAIEVIDQLSTSALSAFSMPYFEGENARSDEGLENVLRRWLDADPPTPLEDIPIWQETARACAHTESFAPIGKLLGGCRVRTTIYHGDFAPWNIRVNAAGEWKVYDWERGARRGVPGWDWFHFVLQKSVMVQRQSPKTSAVLLERLITSRRFQEYAEAANINSITKPLVLSYLLRQIFVVKPESGISATADVYSLLSRKWMGSAVALAQWIPHSGIEVPVAGTQGARKHRTTLQIWADTIRDVLGLFGQSENPAEDPPSFWKQLRAHWPTILGSYLVIAGLALVHSQTDARITFLPFYLFPCAALTLVVNRRWGFFAALISSPIGPTILGQAMEDFSGYGLIFWNSVMRFSLFSVFIRLLDYIRALKRRERTVPSVDQQKV
jgi:hypothetical protein